MKFIFFFFGLLIVIAVAVSNAMNLHGAINITPEGIIIIAGVIIIGGAAIADRKFFGTALLLLLAIAVCVTLARGGKMPWQP